MRQREMKIAELEQQIMLLTEQLDQQKSNSLVHAQLRDELETKERIMKELETETALEIAQLKRKVEGQNQKLRQYQDRQFNVSRLETELTGRNQIIRGLTEANVDLTAQLVHQTAECAATADDLRFTISTMNDLEGNVKSLENENARLRREIEDVKRRLEISDSNSASFKTRNQKLVADIETMKREKEEAKEDAERLQNEISKLKKIQQENERKIEENMNEISVLKMEQSLATTKEQTQSKDSAPMERIEDSPIAKTLEKLRSENVTLNVQLRQKQTRIQELEAAVETMTVTMKKTEEAKLLAEEKLTKMQEICDKRSETVASLKKEINDLKTMIREKDEFISASIQLQEQRSQEVKKLYESLEAISSLTQMSYHDNDSTSETFAKFSDLSQAFSETRQEVNSLNALTKRQSEEIKALMSTAHDTNEELQSAEHRIEILTQENDSLRLQNHKLGLQASDTLKSTTKKIGKLQENCQKLTHENIDSQREIIELRHQITSKDAQIELLHEQLEKERHDLQCKYDKEVALLTEEVKRLKDASTTEEKEMKLSNDNDREFIKQVMLALNASSQTHAMKLIQKLKNDLEDVKERLLQKRLSEVPSENLHETNTSSDDVKDLDRLRQILHVSARDDLVRCVQELLTNNDTKGSEIVELKAQIRNQQALMKKNERSVEKLTRENKGQGQVIDNLNSEVGEMREMASDQRLSMTEVICELKERIESLEDRNESLEAEFDRFHSIVNFEHVSELFLSVSNLLIEKRREISKLAFQLQQSEEGASQQIEELNKKLKKLSKLEEATRDTSRENEAMKARLAELENHSKENQSQTEIESGDADILKELRQENAVLSSKVDRLEAENLILASKLDELQDDHRECELSTTKEVSDQLQSENDDYTITKEHIQRLVDENATLRDQLKSLMTVNEPSQEVDTATLKSTTTNLSEKKRALRRRNSSALVQEKRFRGANEVLVRQNNQLASQNTTLDAENSRFRIQIKSLEDENAKLQDRIEGQLITIESLKVRLEKAQDQLQSETMKCHSEKASHAELMKQNRSLIVENTRISRENRDLKLNQSGADVRVTSLTKTVEALKTQNANLQKLLEELESKQKIQMETIADLKQKLRISRRHVADLESSKQILVEQGNQLSLFKEELEKEVSPAPRVFRERVKVLINENKRIQKTLSESQQENEAYHAETDASFKQCNQILRHVVDLSSEFKFSRIRFPLTESEVTAITETLKQVKEKYREQSGCVARISREANDRGFSGGDVAGAIEFLMKRIGNTPETVEVTDLRQKINDITTTSDRRKKTAKEYLEKLRDKLRKSLDTIEKLRQLKIELIRVNRGESYDSRFLVENLTTDEAHSIGVI